MKSRIQPVFFGYLCIVAMLGAIVVAIPSRAQEGKAQSQEETAAEVEQAAEQKTRGGDETAEGNAGPDGDATEMPSELLPAELTVGFRAGDEDSEGYGDVFMPVFLLKSGIVFVNPRTTYNDESEEEYNLGIGYRHLFSDKKIILGANLYYDFRETRFENEFHQVGFGVEMLSEWVDARANYYLPEKDKELTDRYTTETVTTEKDTEQGWGKPYAVGDTIYQDNFNRTRTTTTTTRQMFERYELALEGFDWEVGVRLPTLDFCPYTDLRAFAGFYHFNGRSGASDVDGFKGRLELRTMPWLILDAEYYDDDELMGSDYYLGARVHLPFDMVNLVSGRNPFETAAGMDPEQMNRPFSERLTEMVIRDLKVRTEVGQFEEDVEQRSVTTVTKTTGTSQTVTLESDVTFVDKDNSSGIETGNYETPWNTIGEGVDNVQNNLVYVLDAEGVYEENVVLTDDLVLWGNGCPYPGFDQQFFGNGVYPTVDGRSQGPAITMAENSSVVGMRVINSEQGGPPQPLIWPDLGNFDVRRVGILGENVDNLTLLCNNVEFNSIGALLGRIGNFQTTILDNRFANNDDSGLGVGGLGASGTFRTEISGNTFLNNGFAGVEVFADRYDEVEVFLSDNRIESTRGDGVLLTVLDTAEIAQVRLEDTVSLNNARHGILAQILSKEVGLIGIDGAEVSGNGMDGIATYGTAGQLFIASYADIEAAANSGYGILTEVESEGIAAALYGPDESLFDLIETGVDLVGLGSLPQEADTIKGSGPVNASRNLEGGIMTSLRGPLAAVGAFFDVRADENLQGSGITGVLESDSGLAAALFIPSHDVIELAQLAETIAVDNLGADPIGLPQAQDLGPITASDNNGAGIDLMVDGYLAGVAGLINVQANRNQDGAGIVLETGAKKNGLALNLLARVDASQNQGNGIIASADEGIAALNVFMDVHADENQGKAGILSVTSAPFIAGTAMFTSRGLMELAEIGTLALEDLIGPVQLPAIDTEGPNTANGNAGAGIVIDSEASLASFALVSDTLADNNTGGSGLDVDIEAEEYAALLLEGVGSDNNAGHGINALVNGGQLSLAAMLDIKASGNRGDGLHLEQESGGGSATVLASSRKAKELVELLADIEDVELPDLSGIPTAGPNRFNNNAGHGIYLDSYGADNALAVLLDIEGTDNAGEGLNLDLVSDDGDVLALLGWIDASRNGRAGITVDLFADYEAVLAAVEIMANDNRGGDGFYANVEAEDDDIGVFLGGIEASRNSMGGIALDLDADDEVWVAGTDMTLLNNRGGSGLGIQAYADDDDVDITLGEDVSMVVSNALNSQGMNVPTELLAMLPTGAVTANENAGDGVALDLESDDDVWVVIDHLNADGNADDGFDIDADADDDLGLFVSHSTLIRNGGDGAEVGVEGDWDTTIDFGDGDLGSPGQNTIYGNTGFDLNNEGSGTADAQQNWWGVAPPQPAQFSGNVDYSNWLTLPPAP